jgi:hypothetical protein
MAVTLKVPLVNAVLPVMACSVTCLPATIVTVLPHRWQLRQRGIVLPSRWRRH